MNTQAQPADFDDPPPPDPPAATLALVPDVLDPAELIPVDRLIASCEGVTAQELAEAIVLEQQAFAITVIDDDLVEEHVGELIDLLTAVDDRVDTKGERWIGLGDKLHKGFLGLFGKKGHVRVHTQAGLGHLRPLLAGRLHTKQAAEAQRQRIAREAALRDERERKLEEAVHIENTGGSPEEVQQVQDEAETLAPPPVAAQPITNIRGAGTRENWKCEVTSRLDLVKFVALHPEHINLLEVNQTAANQMAKAQKSGMKIPGLRAFNDVVLTKRK